MDLMETIKDEKIELDGLRELKQPGKPAVDMTNLVKYVTKQLVHDEKISVATYLSSNETRREKFNLNHEAVPWEVRRAGGIPNLVDGISQD